MSIQLENGSHFIEKTTEQLSCTYFFLEHYILRTSFIIIIQYHTMAVFMALFRLNNYASIIFMTNKIKIM